MDSKQRARARAVLILICIAAGALGASLYWTQIVNGEEYTAKADKQYARPTVAQFDRGTIFFSSKDGTRPAAAAVGSGALVYMVPRDLEGAENAYEALSHYISVDRDEFMKKAAKEGDAYEEIAHRVDADVAASIRGLAIPGIGTVKESWRAYPGESLAAHALGLIAEGSDGKVQGRYGLERTYERTLERLTPGAGMNAFAELFSGIKDSVFGGEAKEGDIVTTIEPSVEAYLEKVLQKTSSVWRPDQIGGIVIDPHTGEIVAMAAFPSFDPNDLSEVKSVGVFSNPLVEHVHELGSIMKPLTMAIGLDSGAVTPNSTYEDTGTMILSTKKISNFDGRARGRTGMQEVLSQSLNIGAATIALKAGKETFATYMESLGLTGKTGIDLPNEAAPIVDNLESGRDIEIATAAYGQGVAVAPIAMVRALSTLANGGYLVRPHMVREVSYADGTTQVIAPDRAGPVLQPETTEEVTRMLVKVVDEALKNGAIKNPRYSIAAKTGTAQIPDPKVGGYYGDRYLHSFFGYFPAYEPRFLVFLYQIYPKGATYASETLVDPFAEISKFLISYYDIPPDR